MIYSWQTVNASNLAEQVCRPTDYFEDFTEVIRLDQDSPAEDLSRGPVIFGASGLLYPEIAPILELAGKCRMYPQIAWGIGVNVHYGNKVEFPQWLDTFDLVGLRDWANPWTYVPCPSCLHPAFDGPFPEPQHDVIVYSQVDYPVPVDILPGAPRETNSHPASEMNRIIQFLASGKTILTSSYHGAYWGFLLNRRVVVWKPFSTKFHTLKPKTVFADELTLDLALTVPQDNNGFLAECRAINRQFYERVNQVLSKPVLADKTIQA